MRAASTTSSAIHNSDCYVRLIEAAAAEFCRDGFRGASVDRIAAAAGVAKQTLYNHFPSKEALFEESIRFGVRDIVVELNEAPGNIRERLMAFSVALRNRLLSPEGVNWYRTMVAELSRMPELGQIVWRQGPGQTQQHLAKFLEAAMDRGELRRDDPMFAAEMLNSMLVNLDRTRRLLTGDFASSADPERVERIVSCFLRAYRPN
jgi:TetR/AcrR family transcriptional repressor of mexJK operon